MDKKGSRSVQPVSKGLSSDSKKQDGVGGKAWPRSGRRREPTGGSLAKSELLRKPKNFDIKRPRARAAPAAQLSSRAETARLEPDIDAELGSVFLPGSKKQSLNHLLNFVYATPSRSGGHQAERRTGLMVTKKHKYNKEHFLQANCQFVVNAYGDYKQYHNDPDALVEWGLIEQVNVQVSDNPACPICLYPPIAAKMTRCGHIYCWSCLIHYLSLSDKTWRKCPICFESIHKNDLKSVVTKPYKTYNIDDVITFKLMKRPKGSLVTYPATANVRDDEIFKFSEIDTVDAYSKLLLANKEEILSIIDRENTELEVQLANNGDCPENCFIEEALTLLNERRDSILNKEQIKQGDKLETVDISRFQQSKFHYFYQASDGQHIYLHAINARMLEYTYGSLELSPKTLTGKILEKEGGSMTEDLRKRLCYLQHLPVTCQFEVAEIQLKHPTITKETLEHFHEQLEVKKKRRQRRARDEKRREKKIAVEEDRLIGKYPTPNLHIDSETQFPTFECIITPPNSCEMEHAGPSFAKMLASAKKSEVSKWPALKTTNSPPKLINVTGQKMTLGNVISGRSGCDSDPDLEEYEPVPPSRSLGDAIVQALQKAEGGSNEVNETTLVGKKKKKKNKQRILFTTTVAFTGK